MTMSDQKQDKFKKPQPVLNPVLSLDVLNKLKEEGFKPKENKKPPQRKVLQQSSGQKKPLPIKPKQTAPVEMVNDVYVKPINPFDQNA